MAEKSSAQKISKLEKENEALKKKLSKYTNEEINQNRWQKLIRNLSSGLMVLICGVLLNMSVVSFWLKNTVINTSNWVDTTTEVIQNSSIQQDISKKIADELITQGAVEQRTREALPPNAAFLAAPITSSIQSFTAEQVQKVLSSSKFQEFWRNTTTSAHEGIVASLENGGNAPSNNNYLVYIDSEQLILNLKVIAEQVQTQLNERGVAVAQKFDPSKISKTVTLAEIKNLPRALYVFNLVDKAARVLLLLAVTTGAIAITLATSKRKAGIGLTALTAALSVSTIQTIKLGEYGISGRVSNAASAMSNSSAQALYNILTNDLILYTRILAAVSVFALVVLIFTGPSRLAKGTRNTIKKLAALISSHLASKDGQVNYAAIGTTAVIAVLLLLISSNPTVSLAIVLAALAIAVWLWLSTKPNN